MANGRVFYGNLAYGGIMTATSSATSFPASNVADLDPKKTWRSPNKTGDYYVTCSLAGAQAITSVWIFNHNISGGTFQFQSASDSGFTTNLTTEDFNLVTRTLNIYNPTTGRANTYTFRVAYLITSLTKQYYRAKISSATTSDAFYELGEFLILQSDYEFTRNYEQGCTWGITTVNEMASSRYGNITQKALYQRYEGTFDFKTDLTQSDIMTNTLPFMRGLVFCPVGIGAGQGFLGFMQASPVSHLTGIDTGKRDKSYQMQFIEII